MRALAKASPRVKVYSIGTTEEGREMIAVAVASEELIAKLDENKAKLAKLIRRNEKAVSAAVDALIDSGEVRVVGTWGLVRRPPPAPPGGGSAEVADPPEPPSASPASL